MKRPACLIALLVVTVHADASGWDDRGAYTSLTLGNGVIRGTDAGDYKLMRWRSFEVRLGHDLLLFGGNTSATAPSIVRFDIVHYNEGHPDNNHRDGFAGQLVYSHKLNPALTAEVGAGLYSSMNTTTIDGVQRDDAQRGLLYSAALLLTPAAIAPAHIRIGFNHATMPRTFQSDSLQFGIGRHFSDPPRFAETAREPLWLGLAYSSAITNMSGTHVAKGGALEARQYYGPLAASARYLVEGDDGARVDRRGASAQVWLVQPLLKSVTASFGAGPYLARNRYEGNRSRVHGVYTLEVDYNFSDRAKAYLSFSRVKTYAQMNDRDLYHLGVLYAFGQ